MDTVTFMYGLLGLALLGFGGDMLVRGAVGIAESLRVSPLFTGLVLIGFGTSMPELATSMDAAMRGSPGIALGNVIGSNIANMLLILGLTAVILPIAAEPESFRRDAPMLAMSTLVCVLISQTGQYGRVTGAVFIVALVAFLSYTYRAERAAEDASARLHHQEGALLARKPARTLRVSASFALAGLALVVWGADLLVASSIAIAERLGVPESVIGLTVVAVGTSLPELATSLVAALKRETDIALGNVIGSNLFNILGILGLTALVSPVDVPPEVARFDAWGMLGVTALLLFFATTRARIERLEGAVFLLLYAAYIGFNVLRAGAAA